MNKWNGINYVWNELIKMNLFMNKHIKQVRLANSREP